MFFSAVLERAFLGNKLSPVTERIPCKKSYFFWEFFVGVRITLRLFVIASFLRELLPLVCSLKSWIEKFESGSMLKEGPSDSIIILEDRMRSLCMPEALPS